jgi:hypothetical protein
MKNIFYNQSNGSYYVSWMLVTFYIIINFSQSSDYLTSQKAGTAFFYEHTE